MRTEPTNTISIILNCGPEGNVFHQSKISFREIAQIRPVCDAISAFKPYKVQIGSNTVIHRNNFPCGELVDSFFEEKSAKELYGKYKGFSVFEKHLPKVRGIRSIQSVELDEEKEKLV